MAKNTKSSKKVKYLSSYEEDLIWMSYRYCIGRHTIASNMHAMNIAKNAYYRLSDRRKEFMAYDIRREIESYLNKSTLCFSILNYVRQFDNQYYKPLELFLETLKNNNINDSKSLEEVKKIRIDFDTHITDVPDITVDKYTNEKPSYIITPDINDLFVWADLASLFDMRQHRIITYVENDEEKKCEAFLSYVSVSYNSYNFYKVWRAVDSYLENPQQLKYIDDNAIKKIEFI